MADERIVEMFERATVTNGVPRWNSNGQVPPLDILVAWHGAGLPFDYTKSIAAREADTLAFVEKYRKSQRRRRPSAEEMAEMRAAFGRDTTVVNVITGRRTRL